MDVRHIYASDVAFTPSVKAVQSRKGSRKSYGRMEGTRLLGNQDHARSRSIYRGANQRFSRHRERINQFISISTFTRHIGEMVFDRRNGFWLGYFATVALTSGPCF